MQLKTSLIKTAQGKNMVMLKFEKEKHNYKRPLFSEGSFLFSLEGEQWR